LVVRRSFLIFGPKPFAAAPVVRQSPTAHDARANGLSTNFDPRRTIRAGLIFLTASSRLASRAPSQGYC